MSASVINSKVKIIVEHEEDGYIAYPLGMKGVVIGQGDTFQEALSDVTSAIRTHIEQFGRGCLEGADSSREAFIAEVEIEL
jgi:predicted RNase H-like HicB family nuclease